MRIPLINRNFDKKRLRLTLLLFLLALAIPTLILVKQAYSQLKWEAFHHHWLLAEELSARIDRQLIDIIDREEARAFTDYAFLIVAGDPAANFLQRSPLSAYPVIENIPGLLGYFQIDADDTFNTPLLPQADEQALAYGIDKEQLAQRKALEQTLRQILNENRLVQKNKVKVATTETVATSAPVARQDAAEERKIQSPVDRQHTGAPTSGMEYSITGSAASAPEAAESFSDPTQFVDNETEETPSQAAFDRLSEMDADTKPRALSKKSAELRVEDLKLSEVYQQKTSNEAQSLTRNTIEMPQRSARKERSALPEAPAIKTEPETAAGQRQRSTVAINIFESEIDPFEISRLDSGHLILFRKVWRDGQRYIQGALIEQQTFINGAVETAFHETTLSQMSNLVIAYGGDVIGSVAGAEMGFYLSDAAELSGALLYRSYLSAPFNGLELIFSLTRLPPGPGARVISWVTFIILLVLCGGVWLMYRLGLRQLALVNQQQDFVSAVSHELKTPLTSIRMYGEMLKQGWADESKKKIYYDFIFDESERLTRLINNVLQLARMTRNDFDIKLQSVSVGELIDVIRSKTATQIESAGFQLNLQSDDATRATLLETDTDIFTQIIINLVDNAIKFSAKAENKQIDIGVRLQSNNHILCSIRDYGPGVAKNQMKKIFSLFYRVENELNRETTGTGIGLALVHQLTQAMHGQVDVLNCEPGAEFRLLFPCFTPAAKT